MPPQTTVPPFATARSASGTCAPTGAKRIAASNGAGGSSVELPAQTAPRVDEQVPVVDGDPTVIPLAEKRRYLEHLNGLMLSASDRIADTSATYYDDRTEWWYANSEGSWLHEVRPEIGLSAQATAREDGRIERSLESLGLRQGWNHLVPGCLQLGSLLLEVMGERFTHVADQMPAIRHLLGSWCAPTCSFGVSSRPVAADDLHPRMRLEPRGESLGRTNGQKVHHAMRFQVH